MYLVYSAAAVDNDTIATGLGKVEECLPDGLVKVFSLIFHAIFVLAYASQAGLSGEVDDTSEVRPGAFERGFCNFNNGGVSDFSGDSLVGERAGKPAVGNNALAGVKGRSDFFGVELSSTGHIKQNFCVDGHGGMSVVKKDLANFVADDRAARITYGEHRLAATFQRLAKQSGLGGFTGAVGAVQDNEFSAEG